jgi:hypothetical protein
MSELFGHGMSPSNRDAALLADKVLLERKHRTMSIVHQLCCRIAFVGLVAALWAAPTACYAGAQNETQAAGIANGGFEEQANLGRPVGWNFPPILEKSGYQIRVETENAHEGKKCVLLDATASESNDRAFGNLMQSIDATPFRGKRVRFRAAVRTGELSADGRAQLWFRVDRASANGQNNIGAFDNMQDRPIRDGQWKHYEIVGQVDDDALRINLGLLVLGKGKAWLDDASLEVVSENTPATGAAIAPLMGASEGPPQPFFVWWLLLVVAALALFALSQTKPSSVQRIAFRFSLAYWLLYNLPAPINFIVPVWGNHVAQLYEVGVDKVVRWAAANLLGIQQTLVAPNGSGDTTFDYVRVFACFCLSLIIAAIWSVGDRRQTDYPWLNDLLRSYLRYVLAFIMLGYGLAKLGSTFNQFPTPEIDQLLKPYGDSSPMNLVWTFMGSSRPYTLFCGLGEVVGALLLVWRRTTILGALVSAGVMVNVVMLNFCYDVPVKQFSAHLLLMALYLLLPDIPRLAGLLLWNRPVAQTDLRPPYTGPRTIWIQRTIKAALVCVGIVWTLTTFVIQEYASRGATADQPAFFGSYEVETLFRGGQEVQPLLTDGTRWRTVSLRRYPWSMGGAGPRDVLTIRMMDNTMTGATLTVSPDGQTLTQSQTPSLPGVLVIKPVDEGHIVLSGTVQGQPIEAKLRRLRREDFLLVRRGFRWVNEYPYNR